MKKTQMSSWAETLSAAVQRLGLIGKEALTVHVIGADATEWESLDALRRLPARVGFFGPSIPAETSPRRVGEACVSFTRGLYHECEVDVPTLVVAFNAGLWGYPDWKPTLQLLANQSRRVLFVVTSYTLHEAEDDEDVLEQFAAQQLWPPQENPCRSRVKRPTVDNKGRDYYENYAWQAWALGGSVGEEEHR